MQVFWDLRMQWSNCPYFVAKKDLHWIYLVEKGKSGYSCQDAKFRSTPRWSGKDAHPDILGLQGSICSPIMLISVITFIISETRIEYWVVFIELWNLAHSPCLIILLEYGPAKKMLKWSKQGECLSQSRTWCQLGHLRRLPRLLSFSHSPPRTLPTAWIAELHFSYV